MQGDQDSTTLIKRLSVPNTEDGISLHVFGDFNETEVSPSQWDALVAATNGNFYMTLDWCRTWWRFYGDGRKLHILVLRRLDELLAILPMFVETIWIGPTWLRVAKLVGGDFSIQLCNPPIRDGWGAQVMGDLIRHFVEKCECDAVILSPLSANFKGFQELQFASREHAKGTHLAQDEQIDCHSVFNLPQKFEGFLTSLGKSARANYKRDLNLLNKSFAVTTDTISQPARLLEEFGTFREMHAAQWSVEGKQGHFEDWPRAYEFNLELVKQHSSHGRARLYRLLLNGEPASYQYGFVFNGCFFWRLPARVAGEQWKRYGLGRMGLAKLIESAISKGVGFIEGGQGHYDYKTQMGATESAVYSLIIVSERRGAMGRFRLLKMFSAALNTVYYNVLYRRIYPRVTFLRRPLWPVWIRSRF